MCSDFRLRNQHITLALFRQGNDNPCNTVNTQHQYFTCDFNALVTPSRKTDIHVKPIKTWSGTWLPCGSYGGQRGKYRV